MKTKTKVTMFVIGLVLQLLLQELLLLVNRKKQKKNQWQESQDKRSLNRKMKTLLCSLSLKGV